LFVFCAGARIPQVTAGLSIAAKWRTPALCRRRSKDRAQGAGYRRIVSEIDTPLAAANLLLLGPQQA